MWDGQWIREVTTRGWIILTRDKHIRRNPLERAAFLSARARVFNIRNGGANVAAVALAIDLERPLRWRSIWRRRRCTR